MIGKLKTPPGQGGLGWFHRLETLMPPHTPLFPGIYSLSILCVASCSDLSFIDKTWFVEDVLQAAYDSVADPNAKTVLLTGRTTIYEQRIRSIVANQQLEFDHYGLKPHDSDDATMNFKLDFIRNLIMLYGAQEIEIWEDREKQADQFEKHFRSPEFSHLKTTVRLVSPAGETYV